MKAFLCLGVILVASTVSTSKGFQLPRCTSRHLIRQSCESCLSLSPSETAVESTFQSNVLKSIKFFAGMLSVSVVISGSPVFAAVGEGDLPDGALAYSKVRKYQADWAKLADSVKSRGAEMDAKEILNTKVFLKQLSNEYYDLELLTKGVIGPEKVTEAKNIAKEFRTKIRECDDAATAGNIQKISEIYPSTAKLLSDFFVLLQDVPDEL
eukprot:gene42895-57040_t